MQFADSEGPDLGLHHLLIELVVAFHVLCIVCCWYLSEVPRQG